MRYNVILIDPRPASRDAMIDLLQRSAPVWGVEFTLPALTPYIEHNLDGQHVEGASNRAAVELAMEIDLPSPDTMLAIVRPDPDALGAVAVLNLRARGEQIDSEIVTHIAQNDSFEHGPWPGPRPFEMDEQESAFSGLGLIALDFKQPIEQRINVFERLLSGGNCPELPAAQQQARANAERVQNSSRIEKISDDLVYVESADFGATGVAYRVAPVAIVANPNFRFQGGEPHLKYTVCAFRPEYVDFPGLLKALQEREQGWGGNVNSGILGSPQGISSQIGRDEIVSLVQQFVQY